MANFRRLLRKTDPVRFPGRKQGESNADFLNRCHVWIFKQAEPEKWEMFLKAAQDKALAEAALEAYNSEQG